MDTGAHYHKCDFQVHTPRDLNWDGDRPVSEEERSEYARAFVAACRDRGLDAVAITDHHDLAFFKFIRDAAASETDDNNAPLPQEKRLIVFPGMELTLGIPCQAILIFDADLPIEFLPLAQTALGITPAPATDAKHAPIKKLDIMSFDELYDQLQKLDPLRDRFIVFPHVGDGGYKSLLRKDFEKHYASMPCVGGYLDGALPVPPKSQGMRNITNGLDKNWGAKAIGLLQTSDSRSADFKELGRHVTWVKWARPTAEALRQACLARDSRIAHSEPHLPAVQITRLEVSNSKFMGPITVEFNPQYNALIGGRGTGKSTILEYLRWALCDQPPSAAGLAGSDIPDVHLRRQSLIEGTLLPLDATVDVSFLLNAVPHIVRRKASGDLQLKIADAPFQACTEQDIRELLPIRAYSQKQLSAVGARVEELRRFVHAPIQGDLEASDSRIITLASELRMAYDRVTRLRVLQRELTVHEIERKSVSEQIARLRASLKGLAPEDSAVITKQASYEAEKRVINALERDLAVVRDAVTTANASVARLPTKLGDVSTLENAALLTAAHNSLTSWVQKTQTALAQVLHELSARAAEAPLELHFQSVEEWRQRRAAHAIRYEQAKARATVHEETLRQTTLLESRLTELTDMADAKTQQLQKLGDPEVDSVRLWEDWKSANRARADLLSAQCEKLTSVSTRLRASLRRSADLEPLATTLRDVFKGTKIRGERVERIVEGIRSSADPLQAWEAVLRDLRELAWLNVEDEATAVPPSLPRLDNAGFTSKEKVALARQFQPSGWIDLAVFDLRDMPTFTYQLRDDDFIPFDKASPGQQATALLSILLLQHGPPLVIDQPEDDLNMKIINEVVTTLWKAKTHRQVLFTSHNANLVVNGDAELIICCDYRTSATEAGGQIKQTGAIDVPEINREIADVMEGGVAAFKLRRQKYGF